MKRNDKKELGFPIYHGQISVTLGSVIAGCNCTLQSVRRNNLKKNQTLFDYSSIGSGQRVGTSVGSPFVLFLFLVRPFRPRPSCFQLGSDRDFARIRLDLFRLHRRVFRVRCFRLRYFRFDHAPTKSASFLRRPQRSERLVAFHSLRALLR